MTVLTTAWEASNPDAPTPARPTATPPSPPAPAGLDRCARCAGPGPLTPVRDVVSKVFTAYDGWTRPGGSGGLCPVCAWGYATTALRSSITLVTRQPAAAAACTRERARDLLLTGALAPDRALVVPLRPGRKHLLPDARWGRIALDDAHVGWSELDARRLATVVQLREQGFGTRMLRAPTPPYAVLRLLPAGTWAHVLDAWSHLEPWRTDANPWLEVALHLTTPTSKEHS